MKSLVTGATGLLGNNLVRLLLGQGDAVRVLARPGSEPRALAGLDVELRQGGLHQRDVVQGAVLGVDRVFHAAARVWIGRRDGAEARAVNVEGTRVVARACRAAGVRMVHVSTVDALGYGTRDHPAAEDEAPGPDHGVPYVASKRAADRVVLSEIDEGLDAVSVHPVYLLGPWDWKPSSGRLLLAAARGKTLVAAPGGNDFAHAEDVAAGTLAAAERGRTGDRYVLGGEPLSYREALELFARVTGGPRPLFTAPAPLVMAGGLAGDLWGALRGREPELNSGIARLSCLPHHFSDRRAREELGYRSRPAEAAARDAWCWFLEHGYART